MTVVSKTAGIIVLKPRHPALHENIEVEVHWEDEDHWGGYHTIDYYAGHKVWNKRNYDVVEDLRNEIPVVD
jgi:hypothetical protein